MAVTAQWADEARDVVRVAAGDDVRLIPADLANADFARLVHGDAARGLDPVVIADPPAPSLDALKGVAGAALEAEYAARLGAGAAWSGRAWAITPEHAAMLDLVLAAVDRYGADKHDGTWTDRAGTSVPVTAAELPGLAEACFDRAAALGRVYGQHLGAILSAPDAAALDAVDVTAGWPA